MQKLRADQASVTDHRIGRENLRRINQPARRCCQTVVMTLETPRLKREFKTMQRMVEIHCRDHHGTAQPCPDCREFLDYAEQRLAKCPYGEEKPTCAKCPVHCYRKQRR
ncbi:nitrous oxide-stimulated promoter family protein, partial [Thioalkalivibrio sp.]|uniref:nitrous oxide-stimulated promoter family protein n=1 Tax=Thioalkalivibrio sp. TaxID=2093813 RepID=UPI0039759532